MRSGERDTQENTMQTDIVILGGGCGGLETCPGYFAYPF